MIKYLRYQNSAHSNRQFFSFNASVYQLFRIFHFKYVQRLYFLCRGTCFKITNWPYMKIRQKGSKFCDWSPLLTVTTLEYRVNHFCKSLSVYFLFPVSLRQSSSGVRSKFPFFHKTNFNLLIQTLWKIRKDGVTALTLLQQQRCSERRCFVLNCTISQYANWNSHDCIAFIITT